MLKFPPKAISCASTILSDNIERELQKQLRCNAVIHMDPIENDDAETEKQKKAVLAILAEIDPNITMHDFRIVSGALPIPT